MTLLQECCFDHIVVRLADPSQLRGHPTDTNRYSSHLYTAGMNQHYIAMCINCALYTSEYGDYSAMKQDYVKQV